MDIVNSIPQLKHHIEQWRQDQKTIALVPTMGNLHAGHIALVEAARQHADAVVVSIFVNPLQFDRKDDCELYPRTEEQDIENLNIVNTLLVFVPEMSVIYPENNHSIQVDAGTLGDELCGQHRPGHFRGVLTVVAKLFNLVIPDTAVFGEKDYQQLTLIKLMVEQLFFGLRIVSVPTVRADDGLALSSRNGRLSSEERIKAPLLYQSLLDAAKQIKAGNRDFQKITQVAQQYLLKNKFQVDYFEIREAHSLKLPTAECHDLIILVAASLGATRLIDNMPVRLRERQ